jgi:hypothetical protein
MLPKTTERVSRHTREEYNRCIERDFEQRLYHFAYHPEEIEERLAELDREWDIERTLEANASSLMVLGLGLGALRGRSWFLLPTLVAGFLLQHALQGWCPPVNFFRRRGVRTQSEIEQERYALKALRGDFDEAAARPDTVPGERARVVLQKTAPAHA